jgi:transcription termination factor Rho
VAAEALEQSVLESKDREQLVAILNALGGKVTARAKKSDVIQKILEQTGMFPAPTTPPMPAPAPVVEAAVVTAAVVTPATVDAPAAATETTPAPKPRGRAPKSVAAPDSTAASAPAATVAPEVLFGPDGEPLADWEIELIKQGVSTDTVAVADGEAAPTSSNGGEGDDDGSEESRNRNRRRRRRNKNRDGSDAAPQGQPRDGQRNEGQGNSSRNDGPRYDRANRDRGDRGNQGNQGNFERGESDDQPVSLEPVAIAGYLDLRDEGYGFLRVNGYLASRDDAYIPVKLTRQFGLRKGDHVTGLGRPAGRNEKNPAVLEIHTINGADPESARNRPRFEDLTALFPDTKLRLENPADPTNMTARIIDLISPIGKGQRGIIVSPPKAGKTTIMKTIATAIEHNNPEVTLIVLLIDERPEEVTDMRRTVKGEVIASTFDRPSDEHTHVAELCIEKAKRLVEMGQDVVIILDGITRLSRAYNLSAPATGRIMSGGIDAGALYPPKKFFGAARNIEEGGSLTILATALVETNSRMDDAIFEEFKGTGNMELRLDRRLAERRIYPAIDVDASSTRHEELLFDRKQLQMVWKLRRVLSGLAADGNAAPGLELLIDRLRTFRTNDEFLAEISKQPAT